MIGCTSPTAEQKKAETIRDWVDQELGITTPFNCLWSESKVSQNENQKFSSFKRVCFSSYSSGLFLRWRFDGHRSRLLFSAHCSSRKEKISMKISRTFLFLSSGSFSRFERRFDGRSKKRNRQNALWNRAHLGSSRSSTSSNCHKTSRLCSVKQGRIFLLLRRRFVVFQNELFLWNHHQTSRFSIFSADGRRTTVIQKLH